MDRITAIKKSLRAFVCGLVGFLPFIGIIPAIYALVCWAQIRFHYRNQWNPASANLSCGAWLAVLGLAGSVLILAVLAVQFMI